MRAGAGYKLAGGILIGWVALGIVTVLLPGDARVKAPGWLYALIGFMLYRHGMRLAAQENKPPVPRSVSKKFEVFVVLALVAAVILLGFAAWDFFTNLS
jgi:hypothetical protein